MLQNQSDDEGLKEDESAEGGERDKLNPPENKTVSLSPHHQAIFITNNTNLRVSVSLRKFYFISAQ